MKILKLEIENIRGIPDLQIEPKGKSLVIYGPNGSGKSAVVDALDFLLTGKIARLSGEGTEGVSLKKHGPHIDKIADLSNVEASAEIKIDGITDTVRISRKMSKPNELVYDEKYESQLAPILELLDRGQYVFTRREVLKLITAKSSTRAQEIQKVLKLSKLEDIRTCLVTIYNESKREQTGARDSLKKGKQDVLVITGQDKYANSEVLNFVNEQRAKLGGKPIDELDAGKLQDGITGVQLIPTSVNHKNLSDRISNLKSDKVNEDTAKIVEVNIVLRTVIGTIKGDKQASWNAKRYKFTKEGKKLIRETGECPLCDKEWYEGELHQYLQERIDAESSRQNELTDNCKVIIDVANVFVVRIQQLTELVKPVMETKEAKASKEFIKGLQILNDWSDALTSLSIALEDPVENFTEEKFVKEDVEVIYAPAKLDIELCDFEKEVKKLFPESTPEQAAWDSLTKLVERIKLVDEGQKTLDSAVLLFNRASLLGIAYVEARDEILESLYNKIKDRFVGLYKDMHGDDEKGFDASFIPQDSGLNLEVDFYGRGLHPPHAMHSDGHQDSMGVCLFLALSEHLNSSLIDLIILDDVVMSVDTGHRRAFCGLLATNFPDKQFIITTHDTTWANQLRGEGLVNRKQMLKFFDWHVDSGPKIHYEADMWSRIEEDLIKDDVSAASAKLRHGLEEFTRFVCHNLRAKVPYTLDDGGSLGDFLPAAIGTYNSLLSKAKDAASSWDRRDTVATLNEKSERAKEIISRALGEQWTINKTVHFNDWANLGKEDFEPVISAFRELCDTVFACDKEGCDAVLKVTLDGAKINGVRCNCGDVNWNLIKK